MEAARQSWLVSKPMAMPSSAASSVLAPVMIPNPSFHITTDTDLNSPQFATGPAHLPMWQQTLTAIVTPVVHQWSPLVMMPASHQPPLLAGNGVCGLSGAVPSHRIVPVGTAQHPHNTNSVSQAPVNWRPPGLHLGGTQQPGSLVLVSPSVNQVAVTPTKNESQAAEGNWFLGLPPLPPPPLVHQAPIMWPVNAGPQSHRSCMEGGLATSKDKATPEEDISSHDSVYNNFRRWQKFKTLVQRNLPHVREVEALSCFLIPVLRTLARRTPTMSMEEGLWRGLKEWESISNFDRMDYEDMAGKFMEFEAAEEMENPKLQVMMGLHSQPPPGSLSLDPQRPPAPEVSKQPECTTRKTSPKAQPAPPPAPTYQGQQHNKASDDIPPEVVKEYMDIMDWLETQPLTIGESDGNSEEEGMEQKQEDEGILADPDLLSYIDELCSNEDFVMNVEEIIHPKFLEALLSPDAELDLMALTEFLEQEEGLNPVQHISGGGSHADPTGPEDIVLSGSHGSPSLEDTVSSAPPQLHGNHSQSLGQRSTVHSGQPSADGGPQGSSEEEEDLPSLAYLLNPQHPLLPRGLALSPVPDGNLLRRGLSLDSPPAAKSRKRDVLGFSLGMDKTPHGQGVSKGQDLALGVIPSSQPKRRRCDVFGTNNRKKRH